MAAYRRGGRRRTKALQISPRQFRQRKSFCGQQFLVPLGMESLDRITEAICWNCANGKEICVETRALFHRAGQHTTK